MFVWDDFIKTGVPAIDVQHKLLIEAFNELEADIAQGIQPITVKKLLTFLKYYAEWHFEREEKCMDRYQCPVADINKKAHKIFLDKFTRLYDEFQHTQDAESMARRIHAELSDWLVHHIKSIDTKLAASVPAEDKVRTSSVG